MTTLRQIVIDALREGNVIAVGATPEAPEFDEGLRRLQNLVKSTYGQVIGEPLTDVPYGEYGLDNSYARAHDQSNIIDALYVPSNSRLVLNLTDAATIRLSPNPHDGARLAVIDNAGNLATYNIVLDGNGRKIEGAETVTLQTNSLNREWFYRADTGDWVRVTDLTADDELPFPSEFDDYFITLLAIRLNPRYGIDTKIETSGRMQETRSLLRARYRQSKRVDVDIALVRLAGNRKWGSYSSDEEFNNGSV